MPLDLLDSAFAQRVVLITLPPFAPTAPCDLPRPPTFTPASFIVGRCRMQLSSPQMEIVFILCKTILMCILPPPPAAWKPATENVAATDADMHAHLGQRRQLAPSWSEWVGRFLCNLCTMPQRHLATAPHHHFSRPFFQLVYFSPLLASGLDSSSVGDVGCKWFWFWFCI